MLVYCKTKLEFGSSKIKFPADRSAGNFGSRIWSFFGILPEEKISPKGHDKLTGAGSTGISAGDPLTAKQKIRIKNIDPGKSTKPKVRGEGSPAPAD
jgi:hypothetical protein